MTDKRFKLIYINEQHISANLYDNGIFIGSIENGEELIVEVLNQLSDENEQLKQRNNRQAKQLDRLYSLIEEKDWRALSDIIDDFKRCEEQLQRESGTYGDFE